jgi:hypothetical protein
MNRRLSLLNLIGVLALAMLSSGRRRRSSMVIQVVHEVRDVSEKIPESRKWLPPNQCIRKGSAESLL